MIFGYARCSTNEERQDIDRQKRELYTLGVTDDKYIYWEYESGTKDDRTELQKLMDIDAFFRFFQRLRSAAAAEPGSVLSSPIWRRTERPICAAVSCRNFSRAAR